MSDLGNKEILAKNLRYYINISNKDRKQICTDLNIKYSTFSEWVNANKYPRIDKIELLANYFGIEKSDLIEDKLNINTSQPKKLTKDEKEIEKIIENTIENLSNTDGLMFDGEVPATEEEIEQLKSAMRIGLAMAKEKARQKFTPKKYRKDNQTENK